MRRITDIRTPISDSCFLLGFISLSLVWIITHTMFFLFISVALDGCTKCPYDNADQRWAEIYQFNILFSARLMIDAGILLIAYLLYGMRMAALSKIPSQRLLFGGAASYFIAYLDFWGLNIHDMMRCGSGCLPADPMSYLFEYFGYLIVPASLVFYAAMFFCLRKIKS